MILANKFLNNLCGAIFTVCLMAISSYPDSGITRMEILKTMTIFERVFEINLTSMDNEERLNVSNIFAPEHAKLLFYELFLPILESAGMSFAGLCCSASLANTFGRRTTLIVIPSLTIILYVFRVINDVYIMQILTSFTSAGAYIAILTYISEIAPVNIRGILITLPGTMTIPRYLYDTFLEEYRHSISLGLLVSTPFLAFVFCEETPQWYLTKDQFHGAFKALSTYRIGDVNIDEEMDQMSADIEDQKTMPKRKLYISLKMGIGLICFQWFAVGNATVLLGSWLYQSLFENSEEFPYFILYVILISPALCTIVVDLVDRKTLLALTTIGMIFFQSVWCARSAFSVLSEDKFKIIAPLLFSLFLICYYVGIGTLIWVFLVEIYPATIKIWLLGLSFILTYYFSFLFLLPFLAVYVLISMWAPVASIIALIISWLVCYHVILFGHTIIETRGKSAWQIQEELQHKF